MNPLYLSKGATLRDVKVINSAGLIGLLLGGLCLSVIAQPDVAPRPLPLGTNVVCRLADKEVHLFPITLTRGQYIRVLVRRLSTLTAVVLRGPDGKPLVEAPCVSTLPCVYSLLVKDAGEYRLEIRLGAAGLAAGWYEVQLDTIRAETAEDQIRVTAEKALMEGRKLWGQGAKEKAAEKYKEAEASFQALGDERFAALALMSRALLYEAPGEMKQALALWRKLGEQKMEAQTLAAIGSLFHERGESQQALEQYQQALAIQRAIGDSWGEADSLNGLASLHQSLDDIPQALAYRNRACAQ
jgi:hypothetical protein